MTILDLLGISSESLKADGRSLRPTFYQDSPWPARTIPIQAYRGERWRGARGHDYSFQRHYIKETKELLGDYLYDRRTDFYEKQNLVKKEPDVAQVLREYTHTYFSTGKRAEEIDLSGDPEMADHLRALGYID